MKVGLIVAMDSERGIGKDNDLMWHLPADMRFFKQTTEGNIVVMGRKNYISIPDKYRPLPNRENVVLTRNKDFKAEGCRIFYSMESCMEFYKNEEERTVFIIGGGEIYKEALDTVSVNEMYITHVNKAYNADTFFPEIDHKKWEITEVLTYDVDEKHEASFVVKHYKRK